MSSLWPVHDDLELRLLSSTRLGFHARFVADVGTWACREESTVHRAGTLGLCDMPLVASSLAGDTGESYSSSTTCDLGALHSTHMMGMENSKRSPFTLTKRDKARTLLGRGTVAHLAV